MSIFTAVLHKEEDMYVAECSGVGTVSQGKTIEEALNNLKKATGLYLEEFPLKEVSKTLMITFEVAVGAKAKIGFWSKGYQNSLQQTGFQD
ncbi:MAG: type II toxin-antitoxin system HicB family antitoxin [Candidatus Methanoperedens sp.]|nr:type II toxin-antitoxin system HicB family antitoxin [Candidatus Methanoperedens sp.]